VGGDGAFAEDHPGVVAATEINDRSGNGAGCGAAVDDEGNRVSKLLENAASVGTLGQASEICGGCCDG